MKRNKEARQGEARRGKAGQGEARQGKYDKEENNWIHISDDNVATCVLKDRPSAAQHSIAKQSAARKNSNQFSLAHNTFT